MRLQNKVALITGGGSGIGKASCLLFAKEGSKVVVVDLKKETAEATAKEIGPNARAFAADVSKASGAEGMVKFAEETFGRLDVIFNNAGIFHPDDESVTTTTEAIWDMVIDVNLKGVFFGCQYAIPALLRAGGGSIINTASFVAIMGAAVPQIAYTASKGGVLAMTREIAVEFARKNIRANSLCPGPVETPLLAELLADPARRNRRLVHIPMGRFGRPEEMANAALFLASDESSFITGTSFVVDGGITGAYITPE
ncbi:MAG TPA: glucose 1-dehydrogenase [Thermoanaerobaculia bacterium]|jgi:NAD(P)-dependent dehydrogenase (short-subunit alcohol dehydrogenase family)|nr:glucose 1-dehydrogenase [Thermoanaerobaculia bacterium]